jgi:hypothetical protein
MTTVREPRRLPVGVWVRLALAEQPITRRSAVASMVSYLEAQIPTQQRA